MWISYQFCLLNYGFRLFYFQCAPKTLQLQLLKKKAAIIFKNLNLHVIWIFFNPESDKFNNPTYTSLTITLHQALKPYICCSNQQASGIIIAYFSLVGRTGKVYC